MLTAEMLEPIATAVTTNMALAIPVGVGILSAIVGLGVVLKTIKAFIRTRIGG